MRSSILFTAIAGFAISCVAAPTADANLKYVLHEKRDGAPHSWTKRDRAHPDHVLPVRIGLVQSNLHKAEEYMYEVADPRSPNFGKHWSAEKVANVFAPARKTEEEVVNWLLRSGIDASRHSYSTGRNWIEFDATVSETEQLFNTEYHYYEHDVSGGHRIACDEYHLPEDVREHIDFAMPTIQLEGMRPVPNLLPKKVVNGFEVSAGGSRLNGTNGCGKLVTIDCLRALYQFGPGNTSAVGNEMGIGEWADFLYLPDLPLFFQQWTSQPIPADVKPEFISIDGGQTANYTYDLENESGIESALDIQTAYSIIYPQQTRLYQVGDGVNVDSVGTFNIFLDALDASYCTYLGGDQPYVDPAYPDPNEGGYKGPLQCGGAPVSNVFSFSYNQIEAALPVSYQVRQCHEWMKLGLQGVSVLFASGDSGVANRYNAGYENSCLTSPDVGNYVDINGTRFSPSFPTNCPWITAVGATELAGGVNGTIADGEIAVAEPDSSDPKNDYYSGGGFSNVFALPSYQSSAVTNYLTKYNPHYPSHIYNNSGAARAYPDVSAIGLKIPTTWLNHTYGVGGTSASTPIWGGIVTLLNEARIAKGKKSIGFLNSVFYAHPEVFNDITEGSNPGCGQPGFQAQPGWDPVTGLGSPNYPKLKKLFLSLP